MVAGMSEVGNWLPIETAPTDGTPVLLYAPGMRNWNRLDGMPDMVVGLWVPRDELGGVMGWFSDIGDIEGGYDSMGDYFEHTRLSPTHWQPLPAPPDERAAR